MRAYLRSLNPQLPRDVWILQAGGLANMFGNGVIGPFLIIYLHNVRGISLGIAGLVVATGSLAAFASGFVGGALSDRFGPRVVLSGALALAAVAFSLFPLIRETWHAFALNLLVGVATGSFWPSQSTLLSSLTPPARRHAAFAQQRMTMNVGFALGALVAGAIARTAHPSTFTVLFLLNAVTFLVFAGVLQLLPSPRHREEHRDPGRYADVVRNRVFLSYIVLNVIFIGAGIAVMSELLPPFAKNTAHVSELGIGLIWFVFSAGVAIGQLPVVKLVEGRRRLRGLALMGIVWTGALLGVMAGGAWFTGTHAAIVFGIAVGVFALAECLHGAIYAPLVVDLAEPQLLGRYMAFSSSTWQIGFFVGPAVGGFVLQHKPLALWPAAAAICVGAAAYALALERRIPRELHLTPRVESVAGVPGTMANMALATDDPLSTNAQPSPHPADEASRVRRGGRPASRTTRR